MDRLIITEFVNILRVHDPVGKQLVMKDRYAASVIVPLRGRLRFDFGTELLHTDAAHPIFVPRGASYTNTCLEEAESLLFSFQLQENPPPRPLIPFAHEQHFRAIGFLRAQDTADAHLRIMEHLYALLAESWRETGTLSHPIARRAAAVIRAEYADPALHCEGIAGEFHISAAYLRRIFREAYGMPPSAYLIRIRMENARHLLREGRSVTETAAAVGYSDIYPFSRAYKRHFGTSPKHT